MTDIYVSVDIETDGPCPGLNSILSLGAEATTATKTLAEFSCNMLPFPGATSDPDTMKWWATQPEAWAATQTNRLSPKLAISRFATWLKSLPGKPILVAYPAGFDFTFVYFYLHALNKGDNPFVRNSVDIEALVMGATGTDYLSCGPETWPAHWRQPLKQANHTALADAKAQAESFRRILQDIRASRC